MIIAIVQARLGSTRFPNKVLEKIQGRAIIEILLERLSRSKKVDKIIVATTNLDQDDLLCEKILDFGYSIFRGSEKNVLSRYYQAAKKNKASHIIRITGDCPLVDPELVDDMIEEYLQNKYDYLSNVNPPTYPDGLDVEVFSFETLKNAFTNAKLSYDKEHVTTYIKKTNSFKKHNFSNKQNFSSERWTVDEKKDFNVIKNIIENFSPNLHFSWSEVINLKNRKPFLFEENSSIKRNEGSQLGAGQKLYKRAKQIIPGGTMLLSKRPELFLPENWPSYFSKAKGCKVWDLDGNEFIDMSIMGIGTNTLGYSHPEVDNAVKKVVQDGNMSTLNCPEEVYLAEKLVNIHPWSSMVRFARSGGEANAIAIRIARAYSGKDNVAICGYHGWHDWYLSANLDNDSKLDGHLLPGLEPKGVPRDLIGTVFPFSYNDYDSLEKIVKDNDIGVIKMEVERTVKPKKGFLESVRKLATKKNVTLIFDECTSGFRETFGGLHKKYEVNPDMMMLGKALGNGYAITAVLGTEEIMKSAEECFISSTFWTERIGPTAAIKTLEVMESCNSWDIITNIGKNIGEKWKELAKKNNIPIKLSGLPALINFQILSNDWIKYKTLISQELLKKNILASNTVYSCIDHSDELLQEYFYALDEAFKLISKCENGMKIDDLLNGPVCHSGFKRLN